MQEPIDTATLPFSGQKAIVMVHNQSTTPMHGQASTVKIISAHIPMLNIHAGWHKFTSYFDSTQLA